MKLPLLLSASLGLNALFAAGVIQQINKPTPPQRELRTETVTHLASEPKAAATAVTNIVNLPAPEFHWRLLESEDYHRYIANLRRIKCPEQTIQDIIYADVEKVLAKKFRALNLKYKTNRDSTYGEYWKPEDEFLRAKLERDLEGRLVHAERRQLLAELLGPNAERERRTRLGLPDDDGARYPFLTMEKLAQARDIWGYYDGLEAKVRLKYQNYMGDEYRQDYHDIAIQRDAAIKNLLSPTEYNELLLRLSYISGRLRDGLDRFVPTEQEFRSIFRLEYQQFLELGPHLYSGAVDSSDEAAINRRQEAMNKKEVAIRTALGEDRYSDYAMVNSPEYRAIYQAALAGGLPKVTALKAYDAKRAANTEIAKIMANGKLNPEQQQQAFQSVLQSTTSAMKTIMGEAAYNNYTGSRARVLDVESKWESPKK